MEISADIPRRGRTGPMTVGLLLTLLTIVGQQAGATTVYRWTDESGKVSYSDRPPAVGQAAVDRLELQVSEPTPAPEDVARRQQMRELTDVLAKERRERAAERARQRQSAPAYAQTQYTYSDDGRRVYSAWPYRPQRPYPPQPTPPIVEPAPESAPRDRLRLPSPNWPAAARKWAVDR